MLQLQSLLCDLQSQMVQQTRVAQLEVLSRVSVYMYCRAIVLVGAALDHLCIHCNSVGVGHAAAILSYPQYQAAHTSGIVSKENPG